MDDASYETATNICTIHGYGGRRILELIIILAKPLADRVLVVGHGLDDAVVVERLEGTRERRYPAILEGLMNGGAFAWIHIEQGSNDVLD